MIKANLLPKLLILVSLLFATTAFAADVVSGLPVGATTQTIPVTDVTGPYKGEKICYVCDFDKAPDVLAGRGELMPAPMAEGRPDGPGAARSPRPANKPGLLAR